MTPFSCRNQTGITQTQTLSWAFQYCLFLTEPVIEEQISSWYSCISTFKLTQFLFLFQTWDLFHSIPYKVRVLAEGKSSSILTDFLISGNNCHFCWFFSHPVLNIFINDWRISPKDRNFVSQTSTVSLLPTRNAWLWWPSPWAALHHLMLYSFFILSVLVSLIQRLPASFPGSLCLMLLSLCPWVLSPHDSWTEAPTSYMCFPPPLLAKRGRGKCLLKISALSSNPLRSSVCWFLSCSLWLQRCRSFSSVFFIRLITLSALKINRN